MGTAGNLLAERAQQLAPAARHAPARSAATQGCSTSKSGEKQHRAVAILSHGGYAAARQSQREADIRGEHQVIATQVKEGMSSAGYEPARGEVKQSRMDVQGFRQPGRAPAPARSAATYGEHQARAVTQGQPMQTVRQVANHEVYRQDQQHEGQSHHMYRQSSQTGNERAMYQQEDTSSAVKEARRATHRMDEVSSTRQNLMED